MKEKIKNIVSKTSPSLYRRLLFGWYDKLNWKTFKDSKAESEILILQHLLDKDSVFIDVGSNVGAYLYMAQKKADKKNTYGFEPIPELYNKLLRAFSGTPVFNLALSNESGVKELKIPDVNGVTLAPRGTLNTNYKEPGETGFITFKVKTQTLDEFVSEHKLNKIDLIKIDVEGHELNVLEGAAKTIHQFTPNMIIEIEQRHHDKDVSSIIKEIAGEQYAVFYFDIHNMAYKRLDVNVSSIQDIEEHKKSRSYVNNFVFLSNAGNPEEIIEKINVRIKKETEQ